MGETGVTPGDVGTFDLRHGFRRIFNIWEDESLPEETRRDLPHRECITYSDEFPDGHTIVSGTSSNAWRSPDEKYVKILNLYVMSPTQH
jgi:hypothetical protein